IGPAMAARAPPAPAATPAAESALESEKIAEYVLKLLEDRGVETACVEASAAQSRMAVMVVDGALLRVGKNGIRFGGFPEIVLGFLLIFRIAIRMPPQSGLAIRGFDLLRARSASHRQDFVIISLGAGCHSFLSGSCVQAFRDSNNRTARCPCAGA